MDDRSGALGLLLCQEAGVPPREDDPANLPGDSRSGEIEPHIPNILQGSYSRGFEPRRRSEQALLAVFQQACVCGVSTRRVDQLAESLGLRISRSEVSRVCEALDEHVEAFRTRPLEGRYPCLFPDAKAEKVRDGVRILAPALPFTRIST